MRKKFHDQQFAAAPGFMRLRIVGANAPPSNDAAACTPDLEDAYLWLLAREGAR